MKRFISVLIILCLVLGGCAAPPKDAEKRYTATFLTLFDTVTTIVGQAESEEAFQQSSQTIHDQLLVYHRLFDIYEEYEGVNNLKTVNDNAGIAPVKVDKAIVDLMLDCREYCGQTGGKVNAAMGSVLRLWHDARSDGIRDPANAYLPDMEKLEAAAQHISFDNVVIDQAASTVYLSDPHLRLDVGAIAKGWAAQRVAENAPSGMLISVGGNVCATGPKTDEGDPWVIGIQDPYSDGNLHSVYLSQGCVVTSGDYQRTYMVDGRKYHHIIDPETLMPSTHWQSVTVVCADSGLADALSTALFVLPLEEGRALAEKFEAQAFWFAAPGEEYMTPGFEEIIRT